MTDAWQTEVVVLIALSLTALMWGVRNYRLWRRAQCRSGELEAQIAELEKQNSATRELLHNTENQLQANQQLLQISHHQLQQLQETLQSAEHSQQQASSANLAKTEFLSSMSHDLRTPLTAVLGMADLLLQTELDAQQREFAEVISQAARSLLHLVNGLLDVSKIESGKLELEHVEFAPVALLDACLDNLAARALEKNLSLTCTMDPAIPGLLRGDFARLRQVMLNLCSNAVKFTEAGGVHIHLQSLGQSGTNHTLSLQVRDSGPGLSFALQSKLFKPSLSYGDGMGLGLTICQHLVKLMHGQIGVESEVGQGACFWVELALPLVAEHRNNDPWQVARLVREQLQNKRVLLVHAAERETQAILQNLQAARITVLHAVDAVSALQLVQREREIEIAVLAHSLADMPGKALAIALKTMLPQIKLVLLADAASLRASSKQTDYAMFHARLPLPVKFGNLFEALLLAKGVPRTPIAEVIESAALPPPVIADVLRARLLLVEDNKINQKLCVILLNQMGYQVEVANNGKEAIAACQRTPFDLILMDCEMPEMDGFSATREIRRLEGHGFHLQIIAMTANAMAGDRERCLAAGMDDYLSKPINPQVLRAMITQHLPSSSAPHLALPKVDDESEVVDLTLLTDICSGDHATIFAFLDQYLASTEVLLGKMAEAITQQNMPQLRALNHELTGTSANLGVRLMHVLTGAMSLACQEEDILRAQVLLQQMHIAVQAVRAFVRDRG